MVSERLLKKMKQAGLIDVRGAEFTLLDIDRLEKLEENNLPLSADRSRSGQPE